MPEVKVHVPSLLAPFVDDQRVFSVNANSVVEALEAILAAYPSLRPHLEDEAGVQRPHVNVFYNDTELRELPSLEAAVRQGDEITVIQSVSGGQDLLF